MSGCTECAQYRMKFFQAKADAERILRLKSWRIVLASALNELRIRLLNGRISDS